MVCIVQLRQQHFISTDIFLVESLLSSSVFNVHLVLLEVSTFLTIQSHFPLETVVQQYITGHYATLTEE